MTASSSADNHNDNDNAKMVSNGGEPSSAASTPKERIGSFTKKQRLMLLEDEDMLDETVVQTSNDAASAVGVEDVFDLAQNGEFDPTDELMEELEMIGEAQEVAALSDDELMGAGSAEVLALSSPSSPVLSSRQGLSSEPFAVDVSPISPIMMLPPQSQQRSIMRLSPQHLRMDAFADDPLFPGFENVSLKTIASFPSILVPPAQPTLSKTIFNVRISKVEDAPNTVRSRARKRVRDFVIGLQNRHFHPYDPNDLSLGLPDSHPLRPFVHIVKVDTALVPSSDDESPLGHIINGAPKERKKSRRGSVSSHPVSPALKSRTASQCSASDVCLPVGPDVALPGASTLRHPGSTKPCNGMRHNGSSSGQHKVELQRAKFEVDGSAYEGEMLGGLRHGLGVAGYWNGCIYVGEFRKGLEHGIGELRDASGALIFRGAFEQGKICGHGTFYYTDGSVYRGEMREGARHGKGIIWYSDGSYYEGDFVHGIRSGSGTFTTADGSQYSGEWAHDARHGKGTLKLSDGTVLDGQFKDNLPDGRCCVTFASDGSIYEGGFKDGLKDGRGTYHFGKYGAVYEGRFARDVIGGIGTIKLSPGISIELPHEDNSAKSEWMVPVDLQCEIRSVHLKAGFAIDGT